MKLVLKQKSLQWLRDMLASSDWHSKESPDKAAKDSYWARKLLFRVMPETEEQPIAPEPLQITASGPVYSPKATRDYETAIKAWNDKLTSEFVLDDRQVVLVTNCIMFYVGQQKMLSTIYTDELLTAFSIGAPEA